MAHDVFISYSSKDKTTADAVCARLESRGIRCWIAPRDVPPGANYGATIIDAIHDSRVMVLVLSSHANASAHIPNEIERAVSHGVAILPFRIEDVKPAKSLDLFIGAVHWLDALTPPLERYLDQLAQSVLRLLPDAPRDAPVRPPLPIPPPPVPPRPNLFKVVVATASVVALAMLAGFLMFRGSSSGTSTERGDALRTPAGNAAVDPRSTNRSAGQSVPGAAALAGCWQWSNNVVIAFRADGTMTAGPFTGEWRHGRGQSYTFTWPEPVDTLTMSANRQRLTGGNQYGVRVTASRVSGGPELAGIWRWGDVATVVIDESGSVTMGPLSGSWTLANPGSRLYRVTWPKIQDTVALSNDGTRIQGQNQYGFPVSGTKLPGCS